MFGFPRNALAAIADAAHQRPERRKAFVEIWVIAFDHRHRRHCLAGDGLDLAPLPVFDVKRLRKLSSGVVKRRRQYDVFFNTQGFRGDFRKRLGDAFENIPVAPAFPKRVDRA